MLVKRCDRCCKLQDYSVGIKSYRDQRYADGTRMVYVNQDGVVRYCDLCPECSTELVDFMKSGNRNGGN